jgi:AraC family transcriptional regulator
LAKIAIELEQALAHRRERGTPGLTTPRIIAQGDGWTVGDVMCTCGPHDRPYEEQHGRYAIAIVLAGTFQYRCPFGHRLMTPGSLMLGNHGHCFECAHQHGEGDRCVSFWYEPDYFERLASDAGARGSDLRFKTSALPALRAFSSLVARAGVGVSDVADEPWEEFALTLAERAVTFTAGVSSMRTGLALNAEARVSQAVRTIDRHSHAALPLGQLASQAGLSPYHFLRTFKSLTGVTPHQYVLRARLRDAAWRLASGTDKILDVALDTGFGDVSNFNRAFRAEFRASPGAFRRLRRCSRSRRRTVAID